MVDSFLSRIEYNANSLGKKEALTFLGSGANGGVIENRFTYDDIANETDVLAMNLLSSGLQKGDL
jgi:acyl-CoA synthetase (AMP-forming)/AMP-acid ligase II